MLYEISFVDRVRKLHAVAPHPLIFALCCAASTPKPPGKLFHQAPATIQNLSRNIPHLPPPKNPAINLRPGHGALAKRDKDWLNHTQMALAQMPRLKNVHLTQVEFSFHGRKWNSALAMDGCTVRSGLRLIRALVVK